MLRLKSAKGLSPARQAAVASCASGLFGDETWNMLGCNKGNLSRQTWKLVLAVGQPVILLDELLVLFIQLLS